MDILLPKLELWQKDVYKDIVNDGTKSGKIYVVKAKRQVGKSILAIFLLITFGLEKKGTSVVIEPTLSQCRRVFKQIQDLLQGSGCIKSANTQLLTMEFINGSEILFKSAEQEEALRGMTVKNGILIIDEGAFIKNSIYEILYPVVDANNCPILVISTPLFMSGEYYELYERGLAGEDRISIYDWSRYDTSKYLSTDKLEFYRKKVSPQKFLSEYMGEFIKEGSYLFGDIANSIKENENEAVFAGIDWGSGNAGDNTVVSLLDINGNMCGIHIFNNMTPTEQIERISVLLNDIPTLKCCQVELNSIGRIYYDSLIKKVKTMVKGFTTTNDSKREIIEALITAFQMNKISIIQDAELVRELQHYAIEKTATGKITYNGADGVCDDCVISLALAYDVYNKNYGKMRIRFA